MWICMALLLGAAGLTVRLHDGTAMDCRTLDKGISVASHVFESAGLRINWTMEGISGGGMGDISVRILRRSPSERSSTGSDTGGVALAVEPGPARGFVYVFADRLEAIADRRRIPISVALGITIAHEIGHLLLPGHSKSGIMQAELDAIAWRNAAKGWLLFTPAETSHMRRLLQIPDR